MTYVQKGEVTHTRDTSADGTEELRFFSYRLNEILLGTKT